MLVLPWWALKSEVCLDAVSATLLLLGSAKDIGSLTYTSVLARLQDDQVDCI